jgi:hypothetical protein
VSDSSAFLFSLTAQLHFPVFDHAKALFCRNDFGPAFGDLKAITSPFNNANSCSCLDNNPAYRLSKDSSGRNVLSLSNNIYGFFTISELEVW